MEDKELCEHTYGVRKPWFISRVSLSNVERRMDIFLNHEKGVKWPCPQCGKLLAVSDHVRERIWRDLYCLSQFWTDREKN